MKKRLFGLLISSVVLHSFAMVGAFAAEFDEVEFDALDSGVPVLVTPTRLKQSKHDIPASVTRIDAEELKALQIRTIPEALRYVAGMSVGYASGNQPRINYHGTNGLVPRRMQVLVDGMSVYRSGYAEVTWPILPITIQDVWAIEVTRSPSSPTYGQNSMMAVINIITKEPAQVQDPQVIYRQGGQETKDLYAQFGDSPSDAFSYRVSIAKERDEGFDKNFRGEERHDGSNIDHLNGKAKIKISDATELNLFMGFSEGVTELEFRDSQQLTYPDIDNSTQYYQTDLRHAFSANHELKFKTYYSKIRQDVSWVTCQPQALFLPSLHELDSQNPDYAAAIVAGGMPSGGTPEDDALAMQVLQDVGALGAAAFQPTCGDVNEDATESRLDFEVEDTYLVSENFRFVAGAGISQQVIDTQTYANGRVEVWSGRIFGNAEYRWNDLVVNLGAMIEDEEKHLDHPEVSPRLGLNYRVTPSNTIRYAISRAVRTPDILEMDREWNYFIENLSVPVNGQTSLPFYHTARANGDLKPEEIISQEVGLYGHHNFPLSNLGSSSLEYDVKIFYDEMRDLISEKLQYFDYNPTNNTENILTGVEFEIDYTVNGGYLPSFLTKMKLHANYAYLDSDTNNFFERSLYARHTGAVYSLFYFPNDIHMSLAYYGNSPINGENFDGFEFGGGKSYNLGGGRLEIDAKAIYTPDKINEFTVSETFNVQNNNTETTNFYVTARYTF